MGSCGKKGTEIVINVRGMACNHCKVAVEKALKGTSGVIEAVADLDKGVVIVNHDAQKITVEQIKAVIHTAGFEPM